MKHTTFLQNKKTKSLKNMTSVREIVLMVVNGKTERNKRNPKFTL
jgi:hypothetical protein